MQTKGGVLESQHLNGRGSSRLHRCLGLRHQRLKQEPEESDLLKFKKGSCSQKKAFFKVSELKFSF